MRKYIPLLLFFIAGHSYAQLTTSRSTPNNSINYLVQNILLGNGVLASNITFSGDDTAIGFFNGTHSNIGLDSGIILTNGSILAGPGPNLRGAWTYSWPNCYTYGDSDLALLTDTTYSAITSAAVLQFDFVAHSDSIKFQYVWGSEEYPEYVGQFDDAFGFFLSGPGISGPYSHNAENIALIPGTNTPVSINTINCALNYNYYVCNWPDDVYPCSVGCPTSSSLPSTTVQFDGFTVPLYARAAVQCGQTYHIKLAICNAVDCALSSGVFLKSGSFVNDGQIIVSPLVHFSNNSTGDTILYRGNCDVASLYANKSPSSSPDTIFIQTSGTAVAGVDYTSLPSRIIMAPGVNADTLNISAFPSSETGTKTIIITMIQRLCDVTDTQKIKLYVEGVSLTQIAAPIKVCYGQGAEISPTVRGGIMPYTYSWSSGQRSSSISISNITADTTYIFHVTDGCADVSIDTIHVTTLYPITLKTKDTTVCSTDTAAIPISVYASGGSATYSYLWSTGGTTSSVDVSQSSTKKYTVTVTDSCGTIKDSVLVTVNTGCNLIIPNIITPNGNAGNVYFYIANLNYYPNTQLEIYSSWGNEVFKSDNYQNDWNGQSSSGAALSDGVYYYLLTLSDGQKFKGFVQLIR